ncbi:MAG: hypothetical protein K0S32_2614 [Bacteroidetes bacterium]|jgi:uncharacterized low-complexity protein|nr:hypothetical protein [Bacteroidota bacterium]
MEKKSTLVTASMIAGALLSVSAVKATSLLEYNALGTAGEVRTSLVKSIEATCGEKKAETKDATKAKDAKCGEKKAKDAKCGEKKAKDGKCGEGKCGEKKGEHKDEKKPH